MRGLQNDLISIFCKPACLEMILSQDVERRPKMVEMQSFQSNELNPNRWKHPLASRLIEGNSLLPNSAILF